MKIFVATSDHSINALRPFAYLFNKFWTAEPDVVVLNRGLIDKFDLPKKFSLIALGKNTGVKAWCDDLRNYFQSIDDDYFIFLQEDHFLIKPFNEYTYNILLSLTNEDKVGRIALTNDRIADPYVDYKIIDDIQIIESTQTAGYRVSCQPSIWSKEYMLKYMKPGLGGPWEFETQDFYNDGYKILGLTSQYPMIVSNALKKGDYWEDWYKSYHGTEYYELDLDIIKQMEKEQII
jgi:hypothetical protein